MPQKSVPDQVALSVIQLDSSRATASPVIEAPFRGFRCTDELIDRSID